MAKEKLWVIELDFDADPFMDPEEAYVVLREWYDRTQGFVRIDATTIEVGDPDEVRELQLCLRENVVEVSEIEA